MIVDTSGGLPTVELEVGDRVRKARYIGEGEEPTILIFGYTVQAGDRDDDGVIWVGADSMSVPAGSSITDRAGNHADTSWSVSSGSEFRIDGGPAPPAEAGVATYVEKCEEVTVPLSAAFEFDLDAGEDITWGELAEMTDAFVVAYRQLSPPSELQEYHDASLRAIEALRDHADSRPSGDSFAEEFTVILFEILGEAFAIGFDTTKTDEEQERLMEEITTQKLAELFGPDYFAASLAAAEAREALSDETLAILDASDCGLTSTTSSIEENGKDDHADDIDDATATTLGQAVTGALDYDIDVDFFVFEAEEHELYQIDVALETLPDSFAVLYDADEQELAFNDDFGDSLASRIIWEAPGSGGYYVEVSGLGDTGSYTLTVDVSDIVDADTNYHIKRKAHSTLVQQYTLLTPGQPVTRSLDYNGDVDFFVLEAEEGELYQIDVALGTLSDSIAVLYDAIEVELAFNDDYGESLASRLYWEAPSSGEYYVEVGGYGTGSYTVTVDVADFVDDHADTTAAATAATLGDSVPGSLEYEGDIDFFVFDAEEGELYEVDVALGSLSDSVVTVYGPEGEFLASNDDYGESLASRLYWEAPSSGEYYVEVGGYGTGSYTVTVDVADFVDDHGDDLEGATSITVGESIEGSVDYDGDIDFFVFDAEEGELYEVDVALGSLSDSVVTLLGPEGEFLASNDDYGESLASRLYWEAPSSGEYYVEVGGYGTGSYTVTVDVADFVDDHADTIAAATAATLGDSVPGSLEYEGDIDFFVFDAEEGELYEVDVALDSLSDSVVTVYGPEGEFLASNDDYGESLASRLYWEAPSSGDYNVEVGGYGTGSYTVTVDVADFVDDHADTTAAATAATLGDSVPGSLEYEGDIDFFVFDAEEGELYEVDVALGSLSDSVVTLYGPEGEFLASNDDYGESLASRLYWEAPSSGEYYVEVGGYGTGSYTVTVDVADFVDDHADTIAAATAATLGDAVPGALEYEGDIDFFVFEAEEGELYEVDVALGSLSDSVVTLLGPEGEFLASNDDYGESLASRLYWEAPSSGEYSVVVSGYGTGIYTLTVVTR